MKIVDARTGNLQDIPFALGRRGARGSHKEKVILAKNSGCPIEPHDVCYRLIPDRERNHVVICAPHQVREEQRGILLVVRTENGCTQGTHPGAKGVQHRVGRAKLLTYGIWSWGANNGIGHDELWHVEGPSVFRVCLSGREHNGGGWFDLIVTKKFDVKMMRRSELLKLLATDEDPDVSELMRTYRDKLDANIARALRTAQVLDAHYEHPVSNSTTHFIPEYTSLEAVLEEMNVAIPVGTAKIGGVETIEYDTLVPGKNALLYLELGSEGARYSKKNFVEQGVRRLKEKSKKPNSQEKILCLVKSDEWRVGWVEYKDNVVAAYVLADRGGIHRYIPPKTGEEKAQLVTIPWPGHPSVSPSDVRMRNVFNIKDPGGFTNNPFGKLKIPH